MPKTTMKVGPLTWKRDKDSDEECWDVVIPKDCGIPSFCVKNYGGKPNNSSAFSGWRVVGGGPFTAAGGWTSREDAMRGAAPFLLNYYRENAESLAAEAKRRQVALAKWLKEIGA